MNKSYIRELALEYAYKWALKRNPKYYLTRKDGIGPIGKIVNKEEIKLADIVLV